MATKLLLLSILIIKLLIFTADAQMRIYDPNQATLRALGGTNIELILDVPNDRLQELADSNGAASWVQNNIRNYPNVRFRYISVGNEVDPDTDSSRFLNFVLPAMRNVQKAISDAGLQIKVSTATYTGLLKISYPPSEGAFKDNVVGYITPIIRFLAENNSPMLANIYPYFAYLGPPKLELSYALFTKPDNGEQYKNLFVAILDAHYAAQSRLGGTNVPIVSTKGTPLRPGRSIETYLFAMFDEDQKQGKESEKHFGVFSRRDQSSKQEVADKERWKKAAEEASQQADLAKKRADLAKKQAGSANKRAARVELVLDKFMGHYNQQQTQAGCFSFTPPPLPTTFVPETVSAPIPDPYSDPNRYYKVMNPGSSRIPNDDEDGDDQDGNDKDGNDKDGNGNNEDGIGSDESSLASDDE
ncbi:glycoside hydrolase, catalytic domain-containing protein [Tanacetum coccineum]